MIDGRGRHGNHVTGEKVERIIVFCKTCGIEMKFLPGFHKIHPQKYCSKKCEGVGRMLPRIKLNCGYCGIVIEKRQAKIKPTNFCSKSCSGKSRANEKAFWNTKEQIKLYHRVYRSHTRAILIDNSVTAKDFTVKHWVEILKECEGKCLSCGTSDNITIDHVVPIHLGGENKPENIQPLCKKCNSSKGLGSTDYRSNELKKKIIEAMYGIKIIEV